MIWTIARRQFLEYLITWRFGLVLAFSTVLVVLGTSLQVTSLEEQLEEYEARETQVRQEAENAKTFNEVRLGVGRRPSMLAFLCAGQDREMPHFASTGILAPPLEALNMSVSGRFWFIGSGSLQSREVFSKQNPLMRGLQQIDFVFVVGTFLSLLAFLLSFDSISGERETGTLFLVIANSVSRGAVLLGKLIGGLGCLAIALTVALNVALIVGVQSPRIDLSAADWIGIGMLFVASLMFLSELFALGMMVSSRTGRSSTSLIVLLLVWTVAVILVPNVAPYVASLVREMPSEEEFAGYFAEESEAVYEKIKSLAQKNPAPDGDSFVESGMGGSIPYQIGVIGGSRELVEYYGYATEEGNRLFIEAINQYWKIYDARFRGFLSQRNLTEWMGRFSPVFAFTNLAEQIAGTHPSVGARFARQAKQFYDLFVDFARREEGLGLRFFTALKIEEFLPLDDYERISQEEGWKRLREIYLEKRKKAGTVQGLPHFRFRPESPIETAFQVDLVELALLPVLFFIGGFLTFARREEAGRP